MLNRAITGGGAMNRLNMLGYTMAMLVVSAAAQAQTYPSKPVRIVVPYAAGGPYDELARLLSAPLTEIWSQPVVVDPRGGAGGNIGADTVAKSPPDGYTLLLGNAGPITINPSLQKKMPYDAQRDLIPIVTVMAAQMVLVVHPSLPVKSVKELVAFAKARPGQINYASAGIGNTQHLAMEYLQSLSGMKLNHVPYKGAAPAFIDVIAGQCSLMFANITGAMNYINSGRVRVIAVSSAKRAAVLPAVPAIAETFPEFDITTWVGIFVPAGTSRDINNKLQADFMTVLARKDIRERIASQGGEVVAATGEQLAAHIRRETALYAKVVQSAGIKPE
jgi:tripartite-type tricarboxylate transporter receptor subunit TctC